MIEYKDAIPAAGGQIDFLYDAATGQISNRISGSGPWGTTFVALSLDGRRMLAAVPPAGLGGVMIYPQPSLLAFMQSDAEGMWGRNCPYCEKYFRTNHIIGATYCPYCSGAAPELAFTSKAQRTYLAANYDAYARATLYKQSTSLDIANVRDSTSNWHYSEEKQQFHFTCVTDGCHTQTDILGRYGYCPGCSRTNARKLFAEFIENELSRLDDTKSKVSDRQERGVIWENMIVDAVSKFEALAKHARRKLLCYPMTAKRRSQLEKLNFQQPLVADEALEQWFGFGILEWTGKPTNQPRKIAQSEIPFIRKMIQKRHILIHNGGSVDQEYLEKSGDSQVRLDERIRVRSGEARRFLKIVGELGLNLLDNIEDGFDVR
jgi:hypothetical protein